MTTLSTTKADDIAGVLEDEIVGGAIEPGTVLRQEQLSERFGVSRTPVREALQRLQNEGFVRVATNQGAVVVDWNDEHTNDVFELRALLEPYGAARAATRSSPEGIEQLRSLAISQYEESHRRRPGYRERIGDLNSRFHRLLHEFADSPRLSMLMPMLIEAPLVMRTFTKYDEAELLRSASHHLEIVSALEARDADWAAAIMRSHIHAARYSTRRRK